MREIKFRAWDEDGFMFTPTKIDFSSDPPMIWNNNIFGALGSAVVALMQYTGLKDKNGKEIYESDIIKWENGGIYKVVFRRGRFMAISRGKNYLEVNELENYNDHPCEILGNIYENPQLL